MTDRLPTVLPLDPERTTLASLRSPIETWNNDGMLRRTALFQERGAARWVSWRASRDSLGARRGAAFRV